MSRDGCAEGGVCLGVPNLSERTALSFNLHLFFSPYVGGVWRLYIPQDFEISRSDAATFVRTWLVLKSELLSVFMGEEGESAIATQIRNMELTAGQTAQLRNVLDGVLRDSMYSLLLGLDGASSIGRDQQVFQILDERGIAVSSCGELETEAWKQFHAGP